MTALFKIVTDPLPPLPADITPVRFPHAPNFQWMIFSVDRATDRCGVQELNDLLVKCFAKEPSERPTAATLLLHPVIVKSKPEKVRYDLIPIPRCITELSCVVACVRAATGYRLGEANRRRVQSHHSSWHATAYIHSTPLHSTPLHFVSLVQFFFVLRRLRAVPQRRSSRSWRRRRRSKR
jgi:serine/threonine protein kinase